MTSIDTYYYTKSVVKLQYDWKKHFCILHITMHELSYMIQISE